MPTPFYLDDLAALRAKLARAEHDGTRLGAVWSGVRRRAQNAPDAFPWFTPFVALVTGREADLEGARQAIRNYVRTFESQSYGMGLQFHFWCFAFPHLRWCLYFQWLDSIGAWSPEEAASLREELLTFQLVNFHYGMRTKPDPECVDNQTMSLCLSNALVGHLFASGPNPSLTAARLCREGAPRLAAMLGGLPRSGYSGEGSTYMDYVVGPSLPFLVEYLERTTGEEWFTRPLPPHQGTAAGAVEMIANEWLPGGLLLPWDHYGYSLPSRSCLAWGAHRTGDPRYLDLLEHHADWSHEVSIGWGFDDMVWSLFWWPERRRGARRPSFPSWAAAETGGALVSADTQLYLMQMWDESTPVTPGRAHVNPNALVLSAFGSPLTTDGVVTKDCTVFNFDDTWREVQHSFTTHRANFGSGCAGAHGVLLVDRWEGMRATASYPQGELVSFEAEAKLLSADVTPIYRERWPDAQRVRRQSRLVGERAWVIEDLAVFGAEHDFTARWYLRPTQLPAERGVAIETAEGVRLRLWPILGPDNATSRVIKGYPDRLDGESLQVDFTQRGRVARWLWLAWPDATRTLAADLANDWQTLADGERKLEFDGARTALAASDLRLPFTMPAFMLQALPVVPRWWYRRTVTLPVVGGPVWLRLPRLLRRAALWVNGTPVDLSAHALRQMLMAPHVLLPAGLSGEVELVIRTDVGVAQYESSKDGLSPEGSSNFWGQPALFAPAAPPPAVTATWQDGILSLKAGRRRWQVPHPLMSAEG